MAISTQPTTIIATIHKALSGMETRMMPMDDTSNTGKLIWPYVLWTTIEKLAKKNATRALEKLKENGLYDEADLRSKPAGSYEACSSKLFTIQASVTEPVVRFNPDKLAEIAQKSKYKIPPATMKTWLADAREESEPQIRKSVVER